MPPHDPSIGADPHLGRRIDELERELSQARLRETATAEILRVISHSKADAQPVFDTIVRSALKLCDGLFSSLFQFDGILLHPVAHHNYSPEALEQLHRAYPRPPDRGGGTGRAILDRAVVQILDVDVDSEFQQQALSRAIGWRSGLFVPMLRDGAPIGIIMVARAAPGPFPDSEVGLLKTFADQAVIAIENTRLFEAEQASKRELQESLEYQTATSEVLGVISRSKFDLQPVLDIIARIASQLCVAEDTTILLREGTDLRIAAHHGAIPIHLDEKRPIGRGWVAGRTVADRLAIHVPDLTLAGDEFPLGRKLADESGHRTTLGVPLLRESEAVGCILLRRNVAQPFAEKQIALLQTFADQAVIAIENTRLFEAEQASKLELQESLEYQTAISEVLGIISRSPTDVRPVFDTIVLNAVHLCSAQMGAVYRYDGKLMHLAAHHNYPNKVLEILNRMYPRPPQPDQVTGRSILSRAVVQVEDLLADPLFTRELAVASGWRSHLAVPMFRADQPVGAILIARAEVGNFDAGHIELLKAFADQAVIAIENTRLFEAEQASKRELARSVEELESLGKVSQAVNSSLELNKVLPTILEHACAMSYAGGGTVYVFDKTTSDFRLAAAHNMSDEHIAMVRAQPMRLNSVVVGECATRREVVQVADLGNATPSPLLDILLRTGVRAVLAVPLLHQGEVVGVLVVRRNQPGTFSPEIVRLVEAFAGQSAIAVENARLFGEIAQKSRELEIASQHKSQFVANMSHELRTPLAAILGYAELMQEGFYEPLGQKSLNALTRIRSNGKHLLGLINTVLDIAKIESGQFTLNMTEYAIESVVETVRAATESLAQNKKLTLTTSVDKSLPVGLGDEQRLTQVLLNLVGNAIKFTEAGEVRVSAKTANSHFAVSVADTGPGIPAEHQARIFEQFHQVDSSNTKAKGGTGLGLAIARQIVEMHGGRIWVESTLGKGSTFQMELPIRAEYRKSAP